MEQPTVVIFEDELLLASALTALVEDPTEVCASNRAGGCRIARPVLHKNYRRMAEKKPASNPTPVGYRRRSHLELLRRYWVCKNRIHPGAVSEIYLRARRPCSWADIERWPAATRVPNHSTDFDVELCSDTSTFKCANRG